jgi:hypothetical protein
MTHSTTLCLFTAGVFSGAEMRTLAGFLDGYTGLVRYADARDLRHVARQRG